MCFSVHEAKFLSDRYQLDDFLIGKCTHTHTSYTIVVRTVLITVTKCMHVALLACVAYPTVQLSDLEAAWAVTLDNKTILLMVDSISHIQTLHQFVLSKQRAKSLKRTNHR